MKRVLAVLSLLFLMSGLALADGPETGTVSGKVTNAQGESLPGVMVTIEGERGAQSTTTDESGNYRFALLVPGGYKITGSLEGFKAATAAATVSAGSKIEHNLQMNLETAETITVTSEAPMVDKFNVSAGQT
ncbi:MAG TPA: carboxypeptidase-like regulatory domain-containing protein, partial [Thermoanaerobaculia bacterium]|nr:carboxypeptidase-like regulatory domain-containing protein [Thermoanaerobaculia bacterium]